MTLYDQLGGIKVAVITPYHQEPLNILEQCHQSVLAQEFPCLHVLVADGIPEPSIDHWNCHHVVLPKSHHDVGSTARLIGCYYAIGLGIDAVAFLDADNWFLSSHLLQLMNLKERTDAAFLSSSRVLCRLDGTIMGPCMLTDPKCFIDTSCMLFTRDAFHILHHLVLMPEYAHPISDRVLFHYIRLSGVKRAHNPAATVFYRCGKEGLYRQLGEAIPAGVEPMPDYNEMFHRWQNDGHPSLI